MKIKLTLSYDGTYFCGWQRQSKGVSVQETVEDAISKITGEKIKIVGSGRTDAGVHAEGQVASFSCDKNIPPEKYAKALNTLLPEGVKIIKSEKADDNFDACRSAKKKTYRFSAYIGDTILPLKDRFAVLIPERPKLDVEKMKRASELFIGKHDFKAFCASGSGALTTERTVCFFDIEKKENDLTFTVCGNGFLYNMVRIMVGTLIMVGQGKFELTDVKKMLDSGIRPMSVKTFSPKGLCLVKVEYD